MKITDYSLEHWAKSYGAVEGNKIICTHNAGFFSCFTVRLIFAMIFFNEKGYFPNIDSSKQFEFFKDSEKDLSLELFQHHSGRQLRKIDFGMYKMFEATDEHGEVSFTDYSKLNFGDLKIFTGTHFFPTDKIKNKITNLELKYRLDYKNLCAVFFRGNDKIRETDRIPYEDYIAKAREIKDANPDIKFFVLPDETEFLEQFTAEFPNDVIHPSEAIHMRRKDSCIMYELPKGKKEVHAFNFFALALAASRCKFVINHTGNGAMWLNIYRGGTNNCYQWRNGSFIDGNI